MIRGPIGGEPIAEQSEKNAYSAGKVKSRAPAQRHHNPHDQWWGQRRSEGAATSSNAHRQSTVSWRDPVRYHAVVVWWPCGLANTDQHADDDERAHHADQAREKEFSGHGGHRRERRPPTDRAGQHPSGTEAVAEPPARDLQNGIPQDKSTKDPAHLYVAESVLGHDVLGSNRDVHPVDEHQ